MNEQLVKVGELQAEVAPVVQRANELVIVTPADYTLAAESLKDNKRLQAKADGIFVAPWRKAKANAVAEMKKWDDLLVKPLERAEEILKAKQLAWTKETERIRLAEEARLNAIEAERARKEREKAEAEARRQQQIEEDARRKAEDARRKAEKAKGEERARLEAEANKADRAANAAQAKAEAKTEAAANVQANSVTVASVAPEVKGQSIRKTWKAKLVSKSELLKAASDPTGVAASFLDFNESAASAFARATKGAVKILGVEFIEETILSSSSK
jgi:uncharacterized membrane protein YqiK